MRCLLPLLVSVVALLVLPLAGAAAAEEETAPGWRHHRSKLQRTAIYRYLLEGEALVRLRPGSQVFQHKARGD